MYKSLIPFGLDSHGNEWYFITDPCEKVTDEYQVAYFDTSNMDLHVKFLDFRYWLQILIRADIELIAYVTDDEEQSDMGLG